MGNSLYRQKIRQFHPPPNREKPGHLSVKIAAGDALREKLYKEYRRNQIPRGQSTAGDLLCAGGRKPRI